MPCPFPGAAVSSVYALQIMLSRFEYNGGLNPNFKEGEFKLVISSIEAYSQDSTSR